MKNGLETTDLPVLETGRLVLEKITIKDSEFLVGLLNEPSFLANIGDRGVRNLEQANKYILEGPVDSYQRYGFGMYMTCLKTDHTPIGVCGLVKRDTLEDVDLGFAFKPEFQGQGFAYESSAAVFAYARDVIGLKRLLGITDSENAGSIRVLEKVGLRFEKMIILEPNSKPIKLFAADF